MMKVKTLVEMVRTTMYGNKDVYVGVLFTSLGVFVCVVAQNYAMGSVTNMGPGYFPILIGSGLSILGACILSRGILMKCEAMSALSWRPLAFLLGGVVTFGLLIDRVGLVLVTVLLISISSLGGGKPRLRDVLLLCVGLIAFVVSVFVYVLGVPLRLWPV